MLALITRAGDAVEKVESPCTGGRKANGAAAVEDSLALLQYVTHRMTVGLSICTHRDRPQRMEDRDSNRYVHTRFITALLTNSEKVENTQTPNMDGG